MTDFNITAKIREELNDFNTSWIQLVKKPEDESGIRMALSKNTEGNYFNQADTLNTIDLFYNSTFENGAFDDQGERKIFMNIMKFRTDVAAKQIDIDVKNFKFVPDDYASSFTAMFMGKEFKEWAKESYFGEILNRCVDAFPRYGTVVLKKVGKDVEFVPLQNLRNDQTAESLQKAKYVIEEHTDMYPWEIREMKGWKTDGLEMTDDCVTVYERYGYVPRGWLKNHAENVSAGPDEEYVDAMVIVTFNIEKKDETTDEHIFYAQEIKEGQRPYEECHWQRVHGRWLGVGVGEDLISNQRAKNIVVNLKRRQLSWSAKKFFQTKSTLDSAKNLLRDVQDGDIIDVGVNGDLIQINTQNQHSGDYESFSQEWDRNSDQKAFTYEVATGESMGSGTPYRLGVLLTDAVNSYFSFKREKLGLFLTRIVDKFLIPQFIKDMSSKERIISYFSDEPGYEALKEAAMEWVKSEAVRTTLLSGEVVDTETITQSIQPYEAVKQLLIRIPETLYKEAKFKFDLDITGEAVDTPGQIQSLTTIYQLLQQKGDPRAEQILNMITAKVGVKMGPSLAPGAIPAQTPAMAQQGTPGTGGTPNVSTPTGTA